MLGSDPSYVGLPLLLLLLLLLGFLALRFVRAAIMALLAAYIVIRLGGTAPATGTPYFL